MGLAVSFKLVTIEGSKATYCYGLNFDNFEGLFEVDVSKVYGEITKENEKDIYLNLLNPCTGEKEGCPLLGRIFVKIYKYYQQNGTYPEKGGHYS